MTTLLRFRYAVLLGTVLGGVSALAQTDGTAKLEVTLQDYNGTGTSHYTVAWVTTDTGTFVKSLRKQGPSSWTSSQWGAHCTTWNNARAGSTALDGYTSATATTYSGTNDPVILTWNGRDANNTLMPDGKYRFWVQYAENQNVQGPWTTSGLLWTKGLAGATNAYPDQTGNFTAMKVTWTPAVVAPTITSAPPTGTGTVGSPYTFTCTATGTTPITFSAVGLPNGLTITAAGVISGTPSKAGSFSGTITAANGTAPDATQPFTIVVGTVPVSITLVQLQGTNLVLSGSGPPNGTYSVLSSADLLQPVAGWPSVGTSTFDSAGHFSFPTPTDAGTRSKYYQLRVP